MTAGVERLLEAAGPIVVKEVRQGLRARSFTIFFSVLLVACLATGLSLFGGSAELLRPRTGGEALGLYLTALGLLCFLVIPFTAFRSMLREVEEETWVLLTLTGLGARSIVRGKWVSAMSQALLFGSACAPFVLFCYFLNGVDLVQIAAALALTAGWGAALTAAGLAIGAQARSKLGRTVAHFAALGVLGPCTLAGVAFCWAVADGSAQLATTPALRNFAIGVAVFSWALAWLLLEAGAAGLALPSEAASRGPRQALLAFALLGLAFGGVVFALEGGRPNDAVAGQVITCAVLALAGPFAASERDGWPRQADGGGWLKPGAARSYWLFVALIACSTLAWGGLALRGAGALHTLEAHHARGHLAAAAFPLLYAALGVLLGRLSPLARLGEPSATRLGYAVALVLGVVGSPGVALALEGRANALNANALNPTLGLLNLVDERGAAPDGAAALLATLTLLAVLLAGAVLGARDEVRSA